MRQTWEKTNMAIGYIGVGNMGAPMAKRLIARHELLVHDVNPANVQRMVDAGAAACPDLAEMARRCDVVLLCLPSSAYVRRVILGEGGLAAGAQPGLIIIDQTSGDPGVTRAVAATLAERGVWLMDAPVSGGPEGANAGTIAIMVGGPEEQFAKVRPLLAEISCNLFHTGDVGTAHVAKLANNLISTCNAMVNLEAMALAVKNGLTPEKAHQIFMASSGRNNHLEKIVGPHMITGRLEAGYTLGVPHKDVGLACQLGVESGVPLPIGNLVSAIYDRYAAEIGDGAPGPAIALVMDRLAGTRIVPPDHDPV
jgi:3-hydroxyisobutyrate dehydrogenase